MDPKTVQVMVTLGLGLGIVGFLSATLWAIFREKKVATFFGIPYQLANLNFQVPPWWELSEGTENSKRFLRPHTNYGLVIELQCLTTSSELTEFTAKWLAQEEGIFDAEVVVRAYPEKVFSNKKLESEIDQAMRWEGAITFHEEERYYLDLLLLRLKNDPLLYVLRYQCSILSGTVEGPFYEELLETMEKRN